MRRITYEILNQLFSSGLVKANEPSPEHYDMRAMAEAKRERRRQRNLNMKEE